MLSVWSACEKFESLIEPTTFGMQTACAIPLEVMILLTFRALHSGKLPFFEHRTRGPAPRPANRLGARVRIRLLPDETLNTAVQRA
jgi:hypothetical protein